LAKLATERKGIREKDNPMKRLQIQIVVVVTVILLLINVSIGSSRGNPNPGILPPDSRVQGLTYGEWSARWWQYVLSIPAPENPLIGGTGANCVFQRIGNVGLVAVNPTETEPILCEVPAGMMLYLDILSVECSTLEPPPFDGEDEESLRACALGFNITDLQASIDGVAVENLDQYVHSSPLFEFTVPEDNILGAPAGSIGESVSNGAHLMLAPLPPGEHAIYLHASIPEFEFTVDMNFKLSVTR
jgi:hypothetical protein